MATHLSTPERSVVPGVRDGDNPVQDPLGVFVTEGLRRAYGNQKSGAYALGQKEGNFSRSLRDGTLRLKDLEVFGDEFLYEFGEQLVRRYGTSRVHPIDRAVNLLLQVSEALLEARR